MPRASDYFKACKECTVETGRSFSCKATCEKYIAEKAAYNIACEAEKNAKSVDGLVEMYMRDSVNTLRKRSGKKAK